MKRTIAHALSVLAIIALAGVPTQAQKYRCKQTSGCKALKSVNGTVTATSFRKGDLVSTEDGWTITPNSGWKKVLPKARESELPN